MRLILLGAPGAGKGTQAARLSDKLNIPHISTGDIFRINIKNETELGKTAKEYIDKGMLVPDELTINIVKQRLLDDDCKNGFILDGFPRTIPQAEYLEKALEEIETDIDHVVNIDVSDKEIIERVSGRRVCPNCGATFHTVYKQTKEANVCDVCKAGVIQRDDDKEDTVISRLKTYHEQTEPLIDFYTKKSKILNVVGQREINDTTKAVFNILGV